MKHTITAEQALGMCQSHDARLALLDAIECRAYPIAMHYDVDSADCIYQDADFASDGGGYVLFAAGSIAEWRQDIVDHVRHGGYDLDDYYVLAPPAPGEIDRLRRQILYAAADDMAEAADHDDDDHGRGDAIRALIARDPDAALDVIRGERTLADALGATDEQAEACTFLQTEACGRCGGSGEVCGRHDMVRCRDCGGDGAVTVTRTDWLRLLRLVGGDETDLTPSPDRLGRSAAELADAIDDAADEAELVQSELGGPYTGGGMYGARLADHLAATADVDAMRAAAAEIRSRGAVRR